MALTALKIYNNTCSNEAPEITVIGNISTGGTYTLPEGTNYGTAIVLSCMNQASATAVLATVSSGVVTFTAASLAAGSVVALKYTFQK